MRKIISKKLISGVLNKRKSKKDIDALEPKPALMYCCISIIWFKPFTSFCFGKYPFAIPEVGDGIYNAPKNGSRSCPPW